MSEPVEAPAGRRVAAPDDLRAGGRARPARPLEADDRPARIGDGVVGGAVVLARVDVVEAGAGRRRRPSSSRAACTPRSPPSSRRGRPRSPRRRPTRSRLPGVGAEVELGDLERGVGRVLVHVGVAAHVLDEPVGRRGRVVDIRVARADHRVEVGGDREAAVVDAGGAGALGFAVALLVAAREVVQVGLRDRERYVGRMQLVEELELLLGPPGAGSRGRTAMAPRAAAGARSRAVKRRSTSAGSGPAKNRRLSRSGGGAVAAAAPRAGRSRPRRSSPDRRRGGSSWCRGCRRGRQSRRSRAATGPGNRSSRRAAEVPTGGRTARSAGTRSSDRGRRRRSSRPRCRAGRPRSSARRSRGSARPRAARSRSPARSPGPRPPSTSASSAITPSRRASMRTAIVRVGIGRRELGDVLAALEAGRLNRVAWCQTPALWKPSVPFGPAVGPVASSSDRTERPRPSTRSRLQVASPTSARRDPASAAVSAAACAGTAARTASPIHPSSPNAFPLTGAA